MGHSVGENDYCVGIVILIQMEGRKNDSQQGGNSNCARDEERRGGQV